MHCLAASWALPITFLTNVSLPYSQKIFCGGDSATSWSKQLLSVLVVLRCRLIGNSPEKLDRSEPIGSPMWLICCPEDDFCPHWNILFGRYMGLASYIKYIPWIWQQYEEGPPVTLSPKYLHSKLKEGEFLQLPVKLRLVGLLDIWLHNGEPVSPVKCIF